MLYRKLVPTFMRKATVYVAVDGPVTMPFNDHKPLGQGNIPLAE